MSAQGTFITDGLTVAGVDPVTKGLKVAGTITAGPPAPASFSANLAAVSGNAKATPGNLCSLSAANLNAALRYIQVFNKTVAPVLNDVPVFEWPLAPAAGTTPSVVVLGADLFTAGGMAFSTGISWGVSTTKGTYTAATAADHDVLIGYT
jgi:hypothetical protein